MKNIFSKLWKRRADLRSLHMSIYFNFHYLPFKDAIKLPIILYKPHFKSLKGSIRIDSLGGVKYGMIRLGFNKVPIYPNNGIMIENQGGEIIFKGQCTIGNNSYISIGACGKVEFGNEFAATTTFRLVSFDHICLGDRTVFGWDTIIMDTDFHKLTKLSGGYSRGYAPIHIGADNWFGSGCKIMKRTQTPNYCVIQSGTILSENVQAPEYSVVGNNTKIVVKTTGIWRNVYDDNIEYKSNI